MAENPIRALGKAAALLEALGELREATPRRLAEAVGEPRTSIYRLLASLEAVGFVEPGAQAGSFRLGWKLMQLGSSVIERLDERQPALPVMERIHDRVGETVFLCVRRGDQAVCIERLDGLRVQSLALRLGGSLPLHVGAAPRVLLAWEDRAEWDAYAARNELVAYTEKTPATREALVAQLERTRADGYDISDEDVTPSIASIGAPIFDFTGTIRASLSVGGLRNVVLADDHDEIVTLLVDGAREISLQLGAAA